MPVITKKVQQINAFSICMGLNDAFGWVWVTVGERNKCRVAARKNLWKFYNLLVLGLSKYFMSMASSKCCRCVIATSCTQEILKSTKKLTPINECLSSFITSHAICGTCQFSTPGLSSPVTGAILLPIFLRSVWPRPQEYIYIYLYHPPMMFTKIVFCQSSLSGIAL